MSDLDTLDAITLYRGRLAALAETGEWDAVDRLRTEALGLKAGVDALIGDADQFVSDHVRAVGTPTDKEGWTATVGETSYTLDPAGRWRVERSDRLALLHQAIAGCNDDSERVANLMAVLGGSWTPAWGRTEKEGVQSLDLNPRDFRVWEDKGHKLTAKAIEP